jgi:hypothetical protein
LFYLYAFYLGVTAACAEALEAAGLSTHTAQALGAKAGIRFYP